MLAKHHGRVYALKPDTSRMSFRSPQHRVASLNAPPISTTIGFIACIHYSKLERGANPRLK